MQDAPKVVWSIPYVSVAFFPSLNHNFIAYRSSKVSDCIFEIHQLWQSGFSRVYSNCCSSCSFEYEIMKISPSSHKMYFYNILNFQESTTILNDHTKKFENLSYAPRILETIVTKYLHSFLEHSMPHTKVERKRERKIYIQRRLSETELLHSHVASFLLDDSADKQVYKSNF